MKKINYNGNSYKIKKVTPWIWGVFDNEYCYGEFEFEPDQKDIEDVIKQNLVRRI